MRRVHMAAICITRLLTLMLVASSSTESVLVEINDTKPCSSQQDCYLIHSFCDLTTFKCACTDGFQGDGYNNCTDIDECIAPKCDKNAVCRNFPGGFNCTCDVTRNYVGNGYSCVLFCFNDNNCDVPRARCNVNNSCECIQGYEGSGLNCTDIDECARAETNNCSLDAECVNTKGGFNCQCKNGFVGDGNNCNQRPQKCDEIKDFKPGQKYEIDPDGPGPANVIQVTCDLIADSIVTVIPPLTKFPVAAPQDNSTLTITYGSDPLDMSALVQNSEYCYQFISFSCYAGVALFPGTFWCGPNGEFKENWGSYSLRKCACGAVNSCTASCYCDGNQTEALVTDSGRIMDKFGLPLIKIRFSQVQKDKGRLTLGPLICADNTIAVTTAAFFSVHDILNIGLKNHKFHNPDIPGCKSTAGSLEADRFVWIFDIDIPRDCNDARFKFKITTSGPLYIDPDGRGGSQPVLVYCDMTSYPHVGVTRIPPRRDVVTPTDSSGEAVEYDVSLSAIKALIELSDFCSQYVKLQCRNSRITSGGAFVNVTSSNQPLNYFPGADGVLDSCGCGSTQSCEDPLVKCNCDIADGTYRQDFGYIVNKQHLPVVGVTARVGVNGSCVYTVGPLQCSQKQFGIEPNCEKYRATGSKDSYTYLIDPDGPGGVRRFNAVCKMSVSPPKGVTIIHHTKEKPEAISSDNLTLEYLLASPAQIEALKNRSTICTQEIKLNCYRFSIQISGATLTWTGARDHQHSLLDYLNSCGPGRDKCGCRTDVRQGSDNGIINDLEKIPVYEIDFSAVRGPSNKKGKLSVTLGPLICAEVFPTCAIGEKLLSGVRAVEGEGPVLDGDYTIDPDGVGGADEFSVTCRFPTTIVHVNNSVGGLTPEPGSSDPTSACFDIQHTDNKGARITPEQVLVASEGVGGRGGSSSITGMIITLSIPDQNEDDLDLFSNLQALVEASGRCRQDAVMECREAPASNRVNYTTCDGKSHKGWVGSNVEDKCACGVNGNCAGGRHAACNCDMADNTVRSDPGSLIGSFSPVSQICLSVVPNDPTNGSSSATPELKFKVSELRCDTDLGTRRTCQDACQKAGSSVKAVQESPVYISKSEPVLMGCRFHPDPPVGVLVLKVSNPVYLASTEGDTEIAVDYITSSFRQVRDTFKDYAYCIQIVHIFNAAPENLDMREKWGFYNVDGQKLVDVSKVNETSRHFLKAKNDYSELFEEYGSPKVYTLTTKEELPVIRIILSGFGFVVVVGDAECVDLKTSCQEIMDTDSKSTGNAGGNLYVIDPDGAGEIYAFPVRCEFDEINKNGVSEVIPLKPWGDAVMVAGKKQPASYTLAVTYEPTHQQINALAKKSKICWQGVGWFSRQSPLVSRTKSPAAYYTLYGYGPSKSFGTGSNASVPGCPCSITGTCVSDYACNSDALTSMAVDQGVVSDKDKLPITSVVVGGQLNSRSSVQIRLTSVRCSSWPVDFPGDCSETSKIGNRFGFASTYNSEYFISPAPFDVEPFFARCEFDWMPNNGVTVIKVIEPTVIHLSNAAGTTTEIKYHITSAQLKALVRRSNYCYQAVIFECLGGSSTSNENGESHTPLLFWGGKDNGLEGTCPCGQDGNCGGLDSARKQRLRRCNCDVGDNITRADAGIIDNKEVLPLEKLVVAESAPFQEVFVTVGDLYCAQKPMLFNVCDMGFHDCHPKATCVPQGIKYRCACADGWNGKGVVVSSRQARANGRECIDDDECAGLNLCPYSATCVNTPGSYTCTCNSGYLQTGLTSCSDINECANSTLSNCDPNAHCENLDGSYRCICNRGFRGDGHTCIPVGECLSFGDTHCITYDDRWIDVQGVNEYVLSQDGCSAGQPQRFRIHIQTWKKNSTWPGHYSYIRSVIIYSSKVIRLDQGGQISVDGSVVRNYKEKNQLTVGKVRGNIVLKTVFGLEVIWDGIDIVQVFIPKISNNSLCGLCANYNGRPEDDTTVGLGCPLTSGNLTESDTLFSQSWIVGGGTESINCSPNQPEQVDDLCFYPRHIVRAEISELMSNKTSPYKECLKQKKPTHLKKLREKFEYDLCHVDGDLNKAVCRLAAILAWDCRENEKISISDWSSYIKACNEKPRCPNNMVHRTSRKAIFTVQTCDSDNVTEEADEDRECFCQQGQVLEDDRCIRPEECGCFYNNGYLATGDITTQPDCSKIECEGKNVTRKISVELNKNEECAIVEGLITIRCKKGYIKDENNTCIRDKCYGVKCTVPNMICVNSTCVCKTGYIHECEQCKDIDECATGVADCGRTGRTCINTEGSYACICALGYRANGKACTDIDECDYAVSNCGANSECVNTPGSYHCECCAGYTKDKDGICQRDVSAEQISKCCACHGKKCQDHGVVCGTDGKTYPSYRSLYVAACRANDDQLKVNYKGPCQEKCHQVTCSKQFAVCELVGAVPQCECPTCRNSTRTRQSQMVCASNEITYNTRCHMEAATCRAELETKVKVETIGKPCPPQQEEKELSWSPWSSCSQQCKQGNQTRSRTVYSNITRSYIQETESKQCYSTCAKGPCFPQTCKGPGQVCVVSNSNTASCQCPTCEDTSEELVCGQYGDIVQTFSHECYLQKTACEKKEPIYKVLERRACETRPLYCDVVRNFDVYTDKNGCESGSINFGKCDGGCDNDKGHCCIATKFANESVVLGCQNGNAIEKELSVIIKCECVFPPAVENVL